MASEERGTQARGGADEQRETEPSAPGDAAGGTRASRATVPGQASEAEDETLDLDVAEFARATAEHGGEAGLAGGHGDLGAGGDVAGDLGGVDEEGDEGKPA